VPHTNIKNCTQDRVITIGRLPQSGGALIIRNGAKTLSLQTTFGRLNYNGTSIKILDRTDAWTTQNSAKQTGVTPGFKYF
jgi:hypothetical protein